VRLDPGALVARFEVPDGWSVQAFAFALDCTTVSPEGPVLSGLCASAL
jgi:hypothetical protein